MPKILIFELQNMNLRVFIATLLVLLLPRIVWSQQAVIRGYVRDSKSNEQLKQVSVQTDDGKAAIADSTGFFSLDVAPGKRVLKVNHVGYNPLEQIVRVAEDDVSNIVIYMEQSENELDRVVITGSRQERQFAREVVSINVIKPYLIANTNSNTLSDVMNRVPGVSVIEGQALIRGSVGWSYNVGSRVMVLLDDMPLMGADVGDVQWDLLPIEAAEQVEVIKGPSSVLYGSSASSGTISVRTGWPGNKPETKINVYQGIVDNPRRTETIWWERTSQPFNSGAFLSHKQKYGQFDLVVSGNVHAERSYIQMNDQYRARTYLKTRYRFKNIPGLTAGIGGTTMFKKGGRYFLWQDADSNVLRPYDGSTGQDFYRIWSVDPYITYAKPNNYTISLRLRHYNITRFVDKQAFPGENDAVANIQALDLNFHKQWLKGFSSTAGIYLTRLWAVGNVYPGDRSGYSSAAFVQLEYQRKRWTLTAGERYEFNALGAIQQTARPLSRVGASYKAAEKTFIRGTYGEGFRFPTIGERYVQDRVSGLDVLPNPDLKTERGWYVELGVKQGFKIKNFNAYFDAAFFWQEYQNMIEFKFNQWQKDSFYLDFSSGSPVPVVVPGKIGFKAVNYDNTRTAGMEFTLEGDGNIGDFGIRTLCGYTYTYPVDLQADSSKRDIGNYLKGFFNSFNGLDSAERTSIMPYRNRELIKIDIEVSYKRFAVGYGSQYYSVFEKIDAPLYTLIPGLSGFLQNAEPGDWVHNVRCSYRISQNLTVAFLVNNLANHEYATRPARLDPPRSFNLQMRFTL